MNRTRGRMNRTRGRGRRAGRDMKSSGYGLVILRILLRRAR